MVTAVALLLLININRIKGMSPFVTISICDVTVNGRQSFETVSAVSLLARTPWH